MVFVATDPRADRLREALDRAERSNAWLAKKMGLSRQQIGEYVNGNNTPSDEATWTKMFALLDPPIGSGTRVEPEERKQLPYAGVVPAGEWGDPLKAEEYQPIDADLWHVKRFVTSVSGYSCYPVLHPADTAIWHEDMSPPTGVIVLAQRKGDHGCTVKQLIYDEKSNRPRLLPLNPEHDEPEDGDGWGVIARLVVVERTVRGVRFQAYNQYGIRPDDLPF